MNSMQKTDEWNHIHCVQEIFQMILQSITWIKTGLNGYVYNLSADYNTTLLILSIFINI